MASERAGERVIEAAAPAGRLDLAVSAAARISRAEAQRLISVGRAGVEGRPGRASDRLRGGERLLIELPETASPTLVPEAMDLRVAYEDDDMLVLDKAAGVVVHPAPRHSTGTLLHGLLARAAARGEPLRAAPRSTWPGIVHRLDKETSGLLMAARTEAAQAFLSRELAQRRIAKEYLALVRGVPESHRGRVEAPVGRHPRDRHRMAVVAGGRASVTEYELLAASGGYSLMAVRPLTGRTHQIRAHLAFLRLPIAGDMRYGGGEGPGGLRRQFLHASRLEFRRPSDGATLRAWSDLPSDLRASLDALGGIESDRIPVGIGAVVVDR